tara:strand:+ start:579 stop:818 length:240 start_codon:yes stop_codon:yes gene_type:complete
LVSQKIQITIILDECLESSIIDVTLKMNSFLIGLFKDTKLKSIKKVLELKWVLENKKRTVLINLQILIHHKAPKKPKFL